MPIEESVDRRLVLATMDRRGFLRYTLGAAAMVVAACSNSSPPGTNARNRTGPRARPTLRLTMVSGTFGFPSPFSYIAGPGYMRMILMYDTLLWIDGDGKVLDWLTTSHTSSADGLTWTFVLRDDVRWSDGVPLTAEDVVFTFDYFKTAAIFSALVIAQPEGVASVTAKDPRTVEIKLEHPAVTFERAVAAAVPIAPKHIWASVTDPTDRKVLVGTGPYRMTSFSPDDGTMAFDANDNYFLGKPFVKRIEVTPVGDELSGMRAGALDVGDVTEARPEALAPFRSDPRYGVLRGPSNFTYPLFFNLRKGGALADLKFRQACAKAIDRKDILSRVLGGQGEVGNPGFLPPSHPYHAPVEEYGFDLDGANRLLDQAGYSKDSSGARTGKDGNALRFTLLVGNSPAPPVAELVVGALKAIGVSLDVKAVDLPTLFTLTANSGIEPGGGQVDMAITLFPGPGGTSVSSDPDYLRRIFSSQGSPGPNRAIGYRNRQFDDLARQQLAELNETKRKQLFAQMQEIIAADLPALPLYYGTSYAVFRTSVFDSWYYTPGGFATGITAVNNKQVFVTGRRTGTTIEPSV